MSTHGKEAIAKFKAEHPLARRQTTSQEYSVNKKGEKLVPVIAFPGDSNTPSAVSSTKETDAGGVEVKTDKQRYKFLVPSNDTFGRFIGAFRKYVPIEETHALFFLTSTGVMIPVSALMSNVYERYKDEDGFLYVLYAKENTFGM